VKVVWSGEPQELEGDVSDVSTIGDDEDDGDGEDVDDNSSEASGSGKEVGLWMKGSGIGRKGGRSKTAVDAEDDEESVTANFVGQKQQQQKGASKAGLDLETGLHASNHRNGSSGNLSSSGKLNPNKKSVTADANAGLPRRRPYVFIWPFISTLAISITIIFFGFGVAQLVKESMLDGQWVRMSLLSLLPLQILFTQVRRSRMLGKLFTNNNIQPTPTNRYILSLLHYLISFLSSSHKPPSLASCKSLVPSNNWNPTPNSIQAPHPTATNFSKTSKRETNRYPTSRSKCPFTRNPWTLSSIPRFGPSNAPSPPTNPKVGLRPFSSTRMACK
jgi:hypothetical protein